MTYIHRMPAQGLTCQSQDSGNLASLSINSQHLAALGLLEVQVCSSALNAETETETETSTVQHGQWASHATVSNGSQRLRGMHICNAALPTQTPQPCQRPAQTSQPHSLRQCSIADLHSTYPFTLDLTGYMACTQSCYTAVMTTVASLVV